MKTYYLYLVLIIALVSCGPKVSKTPSSVIQETKTYSEKIDADKALENETTEGALTDNEGFKDIGKFKYSVFFNNQTNELLKIENIEITEKTITENYYFKNNKLVYFELISQNTKPKKIYLIKGKAVSAENATPEKQKFFIAKAKRFQKAFNVKH